MSQVGRKHGTGADQVIAEAKCVLGASGTERRVRDIAALPTVEWHGRTLYTLRCQGTSGQGNHMVHVPVALAWHLTDLRWYFCPYHAGDAFGVRPSEDTQEPG